MERASGVYTPHRLHRMRLATKKLRYSIELADAARVASAGDLVETLKTVQDVLGEIHDLEVLGKWIRVYGEAGEISP
jgi:CHAD domain-containing protein